MICDRRRTFRFKPKKRVFASLGSNLSQVGKIIDISLGGLSFEFISDIKAVEGKAHVDIFSIDEECSLSGLPCSLVYQSSESLPGQKEKTEETFMTVRCGLKFNNLQPEKWCRLDDLFEKNTSEQQSQDEGDNG